MFINRKKDILMRINSLAQGLALGLIILAAPAVSSAQFSIGFSVRIGPPALPVYVQPPCPMDGYLWTPGYWAYGSDGYYWVPGVWVAPPRPGLLWTPGYWGYEGGLYGFHAGYWGPHVGFYGGVNYGFGFNGVGFVGGAWSGNVFRYNTAVVNVNTTVVRNVYVDRTVINNTTVVNNRASFNGPGGVQARPTPQQQTFMREPHVQPTPNQISHEQGAAHDRGQLASVNGGRPAAAAMERPGGQRFGAQGKPVAERPTAAQARPNAERPNAVQQRPNAERPNAVQRPNAERTNAAARPNTMEARPHPQAQAQQRPQPQARPEAPRNNSHPQAERPHAEPHRAEPPHENHPHPEGRGERR
jgi:hypothetical protein